MQQANDSQRNPLAPIHQSHSPIHSSEHALNRIHAKTSIVSINSNVNQMSQARMHWITHCNKTVHSCMPRNDTNVDLSLSCHSQSLHKDSPSESIPVQAALGQQVTDPWLIAHPLHTPQIGSLTARTACCQQSILHKLSFGMVKGALSVMATDHPQSHPFPPPRHRR